PTLGAIALKKGSALLLIAAAVLAGLLVTETGASPNSVTCEGYPQARVFVEAQTWWRTTPGMSGTDFWHVHAGACIPERETLSANTELGVPVMLHDNPGQLDMSELVYHGAHYDTDLELRQTPPVPGPNPGPSRYCEAGYMRAALPKAPLSGIWSPGIRMVNHGDIGDLPVTAHTVRLDPNFHADPMDEGTVLVDGPGEFPEQNVPIDTTLLPDGQ